MGIAAAAYTFASSPAIAGGFIFAGIALGGSIIAVTALQDTSDKSALAPYEPRRDANLGATEKNTALTPYAPQSFWSRIGNNILAWLQLRDDLALEYELNQLRKNPRTTEEQIIKFFEKTGQKVITGSFDAIIGASETIYGLSEAVEEFYTRQRNRARTAARNPGGQPSFTLTDLVYDAATNPALRAKLRTKQKSRTASRTTRKKKKNDDGMGMCELTCSALGEMRVQNRGTTSRPLRANARNRGNRRNRLQSTRKLGKTAPRRKVGRKAR